MSNGLSIAGRKASCDGFDFYETPAWATQKVVEAMLDDGLLSRTDDIYEPCAGAGAIVRVLESMGFKNVRKSDIQDEPYVCGEHGVDIYNIPDNSCDIVFTNPPYNLMTLKEKDGGSVLREFLRISNQKVVLLVNVFFLSSKERKGLLETSCLRHMYVHSDRVTMFPFGEDKPKNGGTKMYVWLVWDKAYHGKPTFGWI